VKRVQCLPWQAAAITLVGQSGIGKPIANDPLAAVQRRPDGLDQVIATRGHYEQRLGLGVPALRRALNEQSPDFLSTRRAAWLACADRRLPSLAQRVDQEPSMSRLARALAAFESDEPAAAQRLPQTR